METFKHSYLNDELKDYSKLIQEDTTCFGKTLNVIEIDLKSVPHVRVLLDGNDGDSAKNVRKLLSNLN